MKGTLQIALVPLQLGFLTPGEGAGTMAWPVHSELNYLGELLKCRDIGSEKAFSLIAYVSKEKNACYANDSKVLSVFVAGKSFTNGIVQMTVLINQILNTQLMLQSIKA